LHLLEKIPYLWIDLHTEKDSVYVQHPVRQQSLAIKRGFIQIVGIAKAAGLARGSALNCITSRNFNGDRIFFSEGIRKIDRILAVNVFENIFFAILKEIGWHQQKLAGSGSKGRPVHGKSGDQWIVASFPALDVNQLHRRFFGKPIFGVFFQFNPAPCLIRRDSIQPALQRLTAFIVDRDGSLERAVRIQRHFCGAAQGALIKIGGRDPDESWAFFIELESQGRGTHPAHKAKGTEARTRIEKNVTSAHIYHGDLRIKLAPGEQSAIEEFFTAI